ncbi:MAG: thioredoxin domain-containing protein [Elusimicrobia bacterium]|nr:thioredoxin domain-containing protein [Elusimicrobiota bacterium]
MTRLAAAALALLAGVPCLAAGMPHIDKEKLARHVHEAFSTPSALKITVGDFKASPVPGWLLGTLDVSEGGHSQPQPILMSADGRWYFLGAPLELKPSKVPGVKGVDEPGLPPFYLLDGRHAVLGLPQDFSKDPDASNLAKIRLKGATAEGPKDAKLTLVEFSDLECPHCRRSHEILAAELKKYPHPVRVVFKNYPLTIHPWAFHAAVAEACAARIDPAAAEKLRDAYFSKQDDVTPENVRDKTLAFAKEAGLPEGRFKACYDGEETKEAVLADRREGDSLGVMGTPTLFINGRRVRGYEWPEVKDTLDEMYGAKSPD